MSDSDMNPNPRRSPMLIGAFIVVSLLLLLLMTR
jgi:hypothetical protein